MGLVKRRRFHAPGVTALIQGRRATSHPAVAGHLPSRPQALAAPRRVEAHIHLRGWALKVVLCNPPSATGSTLLERPSGGRGACDAPRRRCQGPQAALG